MENNKVIYVDNSLKERDFDNTLQAVRDIDDEYKDIDIIYIDNVDDLISSNIKDLNKNKILITSCEELSKYWSVNKGKSFLVENGNKCFITSERLIIGNDCPDICRFIKKCSHIYDKTNTFML